MKKLRIAINGFGRLGRCIARVISLRDDVELVGINDPCDFEILSYLLRLDSTHGAFLKEVRYEENRLFIDGKEVSISNYSDPMDVDFGEVDIVIESSGKFLDTKSISHHLKKGAKKVILSAPSIDDMPTFVMGVNEHDYNGERVVSNASCTTNCLAPLCKILDSHFGIKEGVITTIHSYTFDQKLLDNAHATDKRRSRAAALNIIPTTTGAAKNLYRVLPDLKGKLHGHSVRVPVADVSMLDLSIRLAHPLENLNELLRQYADKEMKGILKVDDGYGVSSDFLGDSHSCIVASDLSFSVGEMAKIMAWYDNEWGYSNRIIDLACYISA